MTDDAFALFEADDDAELARIDESLDKATSADSKETALAALASATVGLNAFASRQIASLSDRTDAAPEAGGAVATRSYYMYLRSPFSFGPRPGTASATRQLNLETRIQKYWVATQNVVKNFGPTQYQISLGFPLVISVTFTWDVPRS